MKKFLLTASLLISFFIPKAQSDWEPLPYIFDSHIHVLHVFDNSLFIGGNFLDIDNINSYHSAEYNGSYITRHYTSNQGGSGFDSFTEHKGKLIGGGATTLGTFGGRMVLEWDGDSWGNSSYMLNGNVYQVLSYNDTLFTVSSFETDVIGFDYVAYHTSSGWTQAGSSLNSPPQLFVFDNKLYAYGDFTTAGSSPVKYFAKWDNGDWVQVGPGIKKPHFPVVFKEKLYAFELISTDSWEKTFQLMEWDGSDWDPLPGQTVVAYANHLRAITSDDNNIYVAGDLLKAGGKDIFNAARFDGMNWYGMGDALDTVLVNTLTVYNGDLYAGTSQDYTSFNAYIYRYESPSPSGTLAGTESEEIFYFDSQNKNLVFKATEGFYSIIKADGSLVTEGAVNNTSLVNLDNIQSGFYIVKFHQDKIVESKKIIIR